MPWIQDRPTSLEHSDGPCGCCCRLPAMNVGPTAIAIRRGTGPCSCIGKRHWVTGADRYRKWRRHYLARARYGSRRQAGTSAASVLFEISVDQRIAHSTCKTNVAPLDATGSPSIPTSRRERHAHSESNFPRFSQRLTDFPSEMS